MDGTKTGQEWRGLGPEVKHTGTFRELVELLVPQPKDIRPGLSAWQPRAAAELSFCWQAEPGELAQDRATVIYEGLAALLGQAGSTLRRVESGPADIVFRREELADDESYSLRIDAQGVLVRAGGSRGLRHGYTTLHQWLRVVAWLYGRDREVFVLPRAGVPGLSVNDRPAFTHRGVMLDISRNRVPHLAQLEELVERLADLKINQLQLYMEHTFAYAGHETVWSAASALDGAEVQALDRFCRARGIELVPNQNSFGHFHRWLKHPAYRHLAEVPEGIEHPFSLEAEPFSLCPTDPGSLALLADLYGQLLPHFSSGLFNSGLDETLDLGRGRSRQATLERDRASVYVDFLNAVDALVSSHGRRMMFWGDVVLQHPEMLPRLPQQGIVLEWGYEADHPFRADTRRFREAGLDFYVCPGTSSWNSFGGRTTNALRNLAGAARAGADNGALGMLITDWGDHGHLQPPLVSWPALFYGAACAWNLAATERPFDVPLAGWLDAHYFQDRAGVLGASLLRLGDIYRLTGAASLNGSALFFALMMPHKSALDRRGAGMNAEHLEHTREAIGDLLVDLPRHRALAPDTPLRVRELEWIAGTLDHAANLATVRLIHGEDRPLNKLPAALRKSLMATHQGLAETLRPLWDARSRPGGREDSIQRFLLATRLLED